MRQVYFSFHYDDIWPVNQIRNSGVIVGAKSAGFADRSLWEESKMKNPQTLKKLIRDGLKGSSVTVVLIGQHTASRNWVDYEIEQSIERGNALLGIHINKLRDHQGRNTRKGRVPPRLSQAGANIYTWTNNRDFGEWVEAAWREQNKEPGIFDQIFRWLGS